MVRKPLEFLCALLEVSCGNAQITFEGDLSQFDIGGKCEVTRRPSISIPLDCPKNYEVMTVPLEPNTKEVIAKRILPRAGIRHRVFYVLISKGDELLLAAYDNWDPDCVSVSADIGKPFLDSMFKAGVIWKYEPQDVWAKRKYLPRRGRWRV